MSQVKIMGECAVLTSTLKLEDIAKLQQIAPEKTSIVDEKGEVVYSIKASGAANISKYGIAFSNANTEGFATATIPLAAGIVPEDRAEFVAKYFESQIVLLNQYEPEFQARIEATLADHAAFIAAVEVLD